MVISGPGKFPTVKPKVAESTKLLREMFWREHMQKIRPNLLAMVIDKQMTPLKKEGRDPSKLLVYLETSNVGE